VRAEEKRLDELGAEYVVAVMAGDAEAAGRLWGRAETDEALGQRLHAIDEDLERLGLAKELQEGPPLGPGVPHQSEGQPHGAVAAFRVPGVLRNLPAEPVGFLQAGAGQGAPERACARPAVA
jgi:hypothetical protein